MNDSEVRYFLSRPTKTRKTFVLVAYIPSGRKKKYVEPSPALRASVSNINKQYLSETITAGQANLLLKELIQSEYKRTGTKARALRDSTLSAVNQALFERFWAEVYAPRYLEDVKSPRYDFQKALRLIEPLSLASASGAELQIQLQRTGARSAELRRATDRLNQLLRYLKRDIRLNKPKAGLRQVNFCTYREFWELAAKIQDPVTEDLAVVLFASGMRLSEALAVTPGDFLNQEILIGKQITKTGKVKLPKREKTGRSMVCPFGLDAMARWVKVENKQEYRYKIYEALIAASNGKISPHDLRHSHAIYLLEQGASLAQVALNLRNRIDVCQQYYLGYAHTEGTLEALKKLLK